MPEPTDLLLPRTLNHPAEETTMRRATSSFVDRLEVPFLRACSCACLLFATLGAGGRTWAAPLAAADFATYADGQLVGQNGWLQYQPQTTLPLTVASGRVAWAGGATANNQDAMLAFPEQIAQPATGSTILNFDMVVNVSAPSQGNPSYFAALNTLTGTATSGNFQNARIAAQATTGGFLFGARVNGQGGYPFAFGTEVLDIGTDYALRAQINMVAGNANDFIDLYVGPDFDNLSFYAKAEYGSGTVSDPAFGAVLISQFGSASVFEPGVSIASMSVSVVPEPSTLALAGLGCLTAVAVGRWRARRRPAA